MGFAAEVGSSILLFFLVFGMSATVELRQVQKQLRNRTALAIGLALQFFILPLCGFLVVKIYSLPAVVGITLLVVTSSPGGSYSNWWCSLFNAELALSVTMTAISTLLSTIMLPANLMLYTTWAYGADVVSTSLDFYALFLSIAVVLGGITAGLIGGHLAKQRGPDASEQFHRRANFFGNLAGIALITLSITVSSTSHKAALWDQTASFYVGVATPAVLGLATATYLSTKCDLHKPERVAVAVEACYQNTGIATSVAITMFAGNETDLATAIGVPLYYGMVVAIMLAIFCVVCWKAGWTKAPKDENFCVMIYNSYEVEPSTIHESEISIEVVYGEEHIVNYQGHCVSGGSGTVTPCTTSATTGTTTSAIPGPPRGALIFEQTDDGSYIIDETSLHKIKNRQQQKQQQQQQRSPSSSDEETFEGSDFSSGGGDNEHYRPGGGAPMSTLDEEQASNGESANNPDEELGRFGRTIAVIKARATGYRQPHHNVRPATTEIDDSSESDHIQEPRRIKVSTRADDDVDVDVDNAIDDKFDDVDIDGRVTTTTSGNGVEEAPSYGRRVERRQQQQIVEVPSPHHPDEDDIDAPSTPTSTAGPAMNTKKKNKSYQAVPVVGGGGVPQSPLSTDRTTSSSSRDQEVGIQLNEDKNVTSSLPPSLAGKTID